MNYYLHRTLFKMGFFKKVNTKLNATINNRNFVIPVINEAGYHNIMPSEPWFQSLLKDLFATKKGAMVDVGMNIGQTLLKTAAIGCDRHYIGFEPNPLCYHVCKGLVNENKLDNFNVFPSGLSDETGFLTLYIDKEYSSGASVLKDFRKNMTRFNQQLNIPVFKGDDVQAIKNETQIAVIKADVEGAELEVVKGLQNTINRTHPCLVLEILPVYNKDEENGQYRQKRQDELLSILKSNGYNFYLINESNCTLTYLTDIAVHGDMHRTNYLFIHKDETAIIGQFHYFSLVA